MRGQQKPETLLLCCKESALNSAPKQLQKNIIKKMNCKKYQVSLAPPGAEEFVSLRAQVGWGDTCSKLAEKGLANSLFHVTVRDDAQLIGMGRVIGDDALFYYIQDVVVAPAYQNLGIGRILMNEIETYLKTNVARGATVALLAAQGKESFYARYGYLERTGSPLGKGMCRFV